jgi:hypothetical protein
MVLAKGPPRASSTFVDGRALRSKRWKSPRGKLPPTLAAASASGPRGGVARLGKFRQPVSLL